MVFDVRSSRELRIEDTARVIDIDAVPTASGGILPEDARKLLSAIVGQARLDGMSALRLRVNREEDGISMSYFGPGSGPSAEWWDMIPPPIEVYPAMMQSVMALSELAPALPIKGRIHARLKSKPFDIVLELPTLHEMILKWEGIEDASASQVGRALHDAEQVGQVDDLP